MATLPTADRVILSSSLGPGAFLSALRATAERFIGPMVPGPLRTVRISGAAVTVRGGSFTVRFVRGRRVLAPLVCRGRVSPAEGGCVVDATIRPSRRWMTLPATGSLLLALSWMLSTIPPGTTLRYALLVGALWALNLGLAAVPVGADPAAEHAGYVAILDRAAGAAPHA